MKKSFMSSIQKKSDSNRVARASSLRLESLEERQLLSVTDLAPLAEAVSAPIVEAAPVVNEYAPIDLSSVADQDAAAHDAHDVSVVVSLGMSENDVTWNSDGRVTSIVCKNSTLTTADISGCDALESFVMKGTVRAPYMLQSLDASGCSALKTLDVGYCSLRSVVLDDCSALESIACYYSANLTSLDLSDCSALTTLQAFNCALTELDVSACPALQKLMISNNLIDSLNLSHNTELTSLTCFTNNLSELDVSACEKLTSLNCHSNNIASLDCSGLNKLETLYCKDNAMEELTIVDCSSLKTIQAGGNLFSVLDTDGLTALTTVDLTGCENLLELSFGDSESLSRLVVSGCSSLESLDCSWCDVKTLQVAGCTSLKELVAYFNSSLASVDVSTCPALEDLELDFTSVAALDVTNNPNLTSLSLSDTFVRSLNLANNAALESLYVSGSAITSLDLSAQSNLESVICFGTPIESIDLSGCAKLSSLNCHECELTSLDVSNCPELTYLSCSGNFIDSLDVTKNLKLETLWCGSTGISTLNLSKSANLGFLNISGCENLTSLDARGCALYRLDASGCSNLKTLDATGSAPNKAETNNLRWIFTTGCRSLETLNVGYNSELTELDLSTNVNLKSLACYYDSIESLDLSANTELVTLQAFNNVLTDLDVAACSKLQKLMISTNRLGGTLDLSSNTELTSVNCFANELDALKVDGCAKLETLNCHTNNIETLDLTDLSALKTLTCSNNFMSSLALDGCSALTSLTATANAFSSLNLDDCKNLTLVNLEGCEQLAALDVSGAKIYRLSVVGCSALESLDCSDNAPATSSYRNTTLLATGCRSLQAIAAANTPIKSVQVNYCPSLTQLDMTGNSILASLQFDSTLESIDMGRELDVAVVVAKSDAWNSALVTDKSGTEIPTTASGDSVSFTLPAGSVDPIEIAYLDASSAVVASTKINASATQPLDPPAVTAATTKVAVVLTIGAVENAEQYVVEYSTDPNYENASTKTFSAGVKTISNLSSATTYYCRVKAIAEGCDDSEWTEVVATTKVAELSAPAISIEANGSRGAMLTIEPATDATYYAYEYSTSPDFSDSVSVPRCNSGVKTISGLDPHTTYYFRACSTGAGYANSPYSYATVTTTLDAPTVKTAVTKTALVLTIDAVDGADKFTVEYSTDSEFSTSVTRTFTAGVRTITKLDYATEYYVRVTSTGQGYISSAATELSATTKPEFLAAPEIAAETASPFVVNVEIAETTAATGYVVEYSKNADFSDSMSRSFLKSGVKSIDGLDCNSTYYFRVCATANTYDNSPFSYATATTPDAEKLDSPTVKTAVTKSAVVLTIGAVEGVDKFVVEYSSDPNFETFRTKKFNAGVRTITGLVAGTTYYVRVRATSPICIDSDPVEIVATTKPSVAAAPVVSNATLDAFEDYFAEDELYDLLAASILN